MKKTIALSMAATASMMLSTLTAGAATISEKDFAMPPSSAKPHTWYHMMNGNVTKEGITKDFEALAEVGFGGVQMFDAGCGIPPGGMNFNSPEWFDMFYHAAAEARRLGLEICIPNCSGWTSSGGPWNPPSNGMKRVVFTETRVKGPSRFRGVLPRETNDNGFYDDINVLAFPTPPAEMIAFPDVKTNITDRVCEFASEKPFTMSGISYQMATPWMWNAELALKVEVADDGKNFREFETFSHVLARSGKVDETLRFHAFAQPLTTRKLRLSIVKAPNKVTFKRAQPEAKMSLSGLCPKTFAVRHEITLDRNIAAGDQIVAGEKVLDITAKMASDGTLDWEVPAGEWTVLRLGYICNGRKNGPASKYGVGLEVDKFSAAALDYHIEQYVARICNTLGPLAGKVASGFNNILVDSYEVGSQNWTKGFEQEFRRRRGYEMKKYLPIFAGHIIGSIEESERFLEDFRRVAADLFAENYAGALAKKCRQYGLLCSLEPYGSCPADNLQYGMYADIPMCEFWSQAANPYAASDGNAKFVSYVAHVWGKTICGAEAFTAGPGPKGGRWMVTPFNIKAQSDLAFSDGVNRLIYHRFAHQPWANDKYLPGMTMGMFGMHLDRTQTWWPLAKPFFRYQSRCHYMLQRGTFVADVLFFAGEESPNQGGNTDGGCNNPFILPEGYAGDVCSSDAMWLLKVENGEIVVPGGVHYRMLAIPPMETMTPKMVRTIAKLQRQGATIVWASKPQRNLGLVGGKAADAEMRRLVDGVFAAGALTMKPEQALTKLGIAPQISWEKSALPEGVHRINWIHRRADDAEWYFVAMPTPVQTEVSISFHTRGKIPEIWDAETGKASPAAVWQVAGGNRTIVRVPFDVCGSKFIVFRDPIEGNHLRSVNVKAQPFAQPNAKEPGALVFLTADYGALDNAGKTSVLKQLNELAKDGFVDVAIENSFAGGDPAPMHSKSLKATYVYRGATNTVEVREHCHLIAPAWRKSSVPPLPLEFETDVDGKVKMWAWQPLEATLQDAFYQNRKLSVKEVPVPTLVDGSWEVSFPNGFLPNAMAKGPDEKVVFDRLIPWNEHANENIRYFSGRATYRKQVKVPTIPKGSRVVIELGNVCDLAQVTVNGKVFDALWRPPFRLDITSAIDFAKPTFALEVCVANRWANRLIGDDRQFAPDCEWNNAAIREIPKWVKEGKPSPTGRHTFTTWKHWSKDDTLLMSGLIGPVKLYTVVDATEPKKANIADVEPVPHSGYQNLHEKYVETAKLGGAPIVFIGDDRVHKFQSDRHGRVQWKKYFLNGRYRAINLGVDFDRTENVLWRIENGELDGFEAKAIVLEVGAANLARKGGTCIDTILGVRAIIHRLRKVQPHAKIILHPILPFGEVNSLKRMACEAVNKELKWLADGKNVWWCDFNDRLLTADGRILREISFDGYNYRGYGYEVWANELLPYLDAAIDWNEGEGRMMAMRLPARIDPAIYGSRSLAIEPQSIIGHSYDWESYKGWWLDKIAEHRHQVASSGGTIDIVFMGDSNTDNWDARGGGDFAGLKNEYSILNLGYSGDSTQHLLWRVKNGELDGFKAKVCVMSIGGNNMHFSDDTREPKNIIAGIKEIIKVVRAKQPQAKLILIPTLPAGLKANSYPQQIRPETSKMTAALADGENVIFCDFSDKLKNADGTYKKEYYGDVLHLNPEGFKIWANALRPLLRKYITK